MIQDEVYMRRCIQLAKNGMHNAPPNPMVGAVIVANNMIIGEGYHVRCGEGHAEVNAFASVKPQHEHLLKEATIYVSLEPCSHYGKTPPCADLIIAKGVRRVVVGCVDPFAEVSGNGIRKIKEAGIEVNVGVCRKECEELNRVFFTFHQKKRPYITLKWAESLDGFIAGKDENGQAKTMVISSELTQLRCHRLRTEHQGIMVGKHTLLCDNPNLTSRCWPGKNPKRILLTHNNENLQDFNIFDSQAETLVMQGNINEIVSQLHANGIQSLLVEGGSQVLTQFISSGLWDEAFVEKGTIVIGNGVKAPEMKNLPYEKQNVFGRDFYHYKCHKND